MSRSQYTPHIHNFLDSEDIIFKLLKATIAAYPAAENFKKDTLLILSQQVPLDERNNTQVHFGLL